jgi:hypothetical protein
MRLFTPFCPLVEALTTGYPDFPNSFGRGMLRSSHVEAYALTGSPAACSVQDQGGGTGFARLKDSPSSENKIVAECEACTRLSADAGQGIG